MSERQPKKLSALVPDDFKRAVRDEMTDARKRATDVLGGRCVMSNCRRVRGKDDVLCPRHREEVGVVTWDDFEGMLKKVLGVRNR